MVAMFAIDAAQPLSDVVYHEALGFGRILQESDRLAQIRFVYRLRERWMPLIDFLRVPVQPHKLPKSLSFDDLIPSLAYTGVLPAAPRELPPNVDGRFDKQEVAPMSIRRAFLDYLGGTKYKLRIYSAGVSDDAVKQAFSAFGTPLPDDYRGKAIGARGGDPARAQWGLAGSLTFPVPAEIELLPQGLTISYDHAGNAVINCVRTVMGLRKHGLRLTSYAKRGKAPQPALFQRVLAQDLEPVVH